MSDYDSLGVKVKRKISRLAERLHGKVSDEIHYIDLVRINPVYAQTVSNLIAHMSTQKGIVDGFRDIVKADAVEIVKSNSNYRPRNWDGSIMSLEDVVDQMECKDQHIELLRIRARTYKSGRTLFNISAQNRFNDYLGTFIFYSAEGKEPQFRTPRPIVEMRKQAAAANSNA